MSNSCRCLRPPAAAGYQLRPAWPFRVAQPLAVTPPLLHGGWRSCPLLTGGASCRKAAAEQHRGRLVECSAMLWLCCAEAPGAPASR